MVSKLIRPCIFFAIFVLKWNAAADDTESESNSIHVWDSSSTSIGISLELDNFRLLEGCLIFITNLIAIDLEWIGKPVFIRNLPYTIACNQLDLVKHSLHSKPWNCQAAMDLLPYTLQFDAEEDDEELQFAHVKPPGVYCDPWWWDWKPTGRDIDDLELETRMQVPSSSPTIHALIVPSKSWNSKMIKFLSFEILSSWMRKVTEQATIKKKKLYAKPQNKALFLAKVDNQHGNGRESRQFLLKSLEHINVHPYCPQCKNLQAIVLTQIKWLHDMKEEVYQTIRKISSGQIQWEFDKKLFANKLLRRHFGICENHLSQSSNVSPRPIDKMLKEYSETDDLLAQVIIHGWSSIMGNYSFIKFKSNDFRCLNGREDKNMNEYKLGEYMKRFGTFIPSMIVDYGMAHKIHLPIYIPDQFNALRFLSCGFRLQSMGYGELVRIFDFYIWICLVTLILVLIPFWKMAGLSEAEGDDVLLKALSLVKALLEQGTPFNVKAFLRENPVRIMLGCFLLIGIVLSNAFKNTNVYNMVKPLIRLPYSEFQELVENKFTVYMRTRDSNFYNPILKENHTKYYDSNETVDLDQLVFAKRENFPPDSINTLVASCKSVHCDKKYEDVEESQILHSLSRCNRTSLVVSLKVAQNYIKKLGEVGAYLGKEQYLQPEFQFYYSGLLSPSIIMRSAYFKETGILDRWMDILHVISFGRRHASDENINRGSTTANPDSAAFQESIPVICVLYVGGITLAMAGFVLELSIMIGGMICDWFKNHVNHYPRSQPGIIF